MARTVARVEGVLRLGGTAFLVSGGKRVLSLHIRGVFAKLADACYILALQSLTGNLRLLESGA